MARKKVKLAFIANDPSRKSSYKKRKMGLLKKMNELSTLCGIEACAIISSPYDTQPEVWPNVPAAQRVVTKFQMMPDIEQSKKRLNQESFINERFVKANEQLKKQRENNRNLEMKVAIHRCLSGHGLQNLSMDELNHVGMVLEQNVKEVNKRIEVLAKGGSSRFVGVGNNNQVVHVEEQNPSVDFGVETIQKTQWLNEWAGNQNENMGFGGGLDMMLPYGDNNNTNATWSGAYYL